MTQGLRIDRSHDPLSCYLQPLPVLAGVGVAPPVPDAPISLDHFPSDNREIHQSHLEDLTLRLQQWAADLDAREARLNARDAMLDHRERALRLQQATLHDQAAKQQEQIAAQEKTLAAERERLAAAMRGQWLGNFRSTMP